MLQRGVNRLSPGYREMLLVLCMLALATVVFLSDVFLFGHRLLPADLLTISEPWRSTLGAAEVHNGILGDPIQAHYPRQLYFWNAVRQGHHPTWNPYVFLGIPCDPMTVGVFADVGQVATGFVSLFLPLDVAWGVVAGLRLLLSGLFMYLLMRHLKASIGGGLLAAIVFMFGANTVVWLEFPHHLAAQLWMPLVVLFFDRMLVRHRWADVVWAGLFLTLMLFNRYLQLTLYMLLFLFLFFLWHLQTAYRQEHSWRFVRHRILSAGAAVGGALLMSSVKILIYYQATASSIRGAQSRIAARPLDPSLLDHLVSRLVTFWLPTFYGDGVAHPYWGPENPVEAAQYIGLLPLCLITVAVCLRPRRRGTLFLIGTASCLLAVRLGAPPLANVARLIPLMDFGTPSRLITIVNLLLAIVAGLGLTALEELGQTKRRVVGSAVGGTLVAGIIVAGAAWYVNRLALDSHTPLVHDLRIAGVLTAAFSLLLFLFLKGRIRRQLMVLGVIFLTFADLFIRGHGFNTTVGPEMIYPSTEATDFLRRDPTAFRVLVLHASHDPMRVAPSDTLQAYQIPEVGGRNPQLPREYYDFFAQVMDEPAVTMNGYLTPSSFKQAALWGMLNAKYVLREKDLPREQLEGLHLVYANELKIYRNKEWLPRAFAVPHFRVLENEPDLLQALRDPSFDPKREALLLRSPE